VTGANTTPLGSPLRMSPAATLAVEPSSPRENAAIKTESGEGKKRDFEVCLHERQTTSADSRLSVDTHAEWNGTEGEEAEEET
jgi:hypothetical protein